ncbi:hypothetical protein [Amycolatopsis magusensis]|uniref:Cytoskeletal protein RodZ n=1 Tax=Amycolatopsis magusensis TaxID=882444 RepID=A0ABS4PKQ1_9PSEU|nr:hypothetical protein [Amycolatopsis magusensis]MBP2179423.1 cytoskeletal protein RodZ [Amycolatopsis magusensis]MDI5978580.1 hypothetical protein [Amycolatopsis magusensis]
MKHEVTVAQLLEREGWDSRRRPKSRSRLQLLSVMAAVVIGCGIAALLVRVVHAPAPEHRAETIVEDVGIIQPPARTPSGVAGPEATVASDEPKLVPGGGAWYEEETTADEPDTTEPTTTTTSKKPSTTTTANQPSDPGGEDPPTTTTSKKPPTTTTTKCVLWPLIC